MRGRPWLLLLRLWKVSSGNDAGAHQEQGGQAAGQLHQRHNGAVGLPTLLPSQGGAHKVTGEEDHPFAFLMNSQPTEVRPMMTTLLPF